MKKRTSERKSFYRKMERAIDKLTSLRFVRFLKRRVLVNAIILSLTILLFLWLLFLLIPHDGKLNVELDDFSVEFIKPSPLGVSGNNILFEGDGIKLPLYGSVTIDGKSIGSYPGYYYCLETGDETEDWDFVGEVSITPQMRMTNEESGFGCCFEGTDHYEVYSNEDDIGIYINTKDYVYGIITIPPGTIIELKNYVLVSYESYEKQVEVARTPVKQVLIKSEMYGEIELEDKSDDETYVPHYFIILDKGSTVEVDYCESVDGSGTGIIEFFNTPNVREYDLKGQRFGATSEKKDEYGTPTTMLKATIDNQDSPRMILEGVVSDVSLMGYSLVSSFWSWINDNVYVIPSMILTIFGGAITIAMKNREKDDKESEKSEA